MDGCRQKEDRYYKATDSHDLVVMQLFQLLVIEKAENNDLKIHTPMFYEYLEHVIC